MSTTYPAFREAVRAAIVEASGLADEAVGWSQDGEGIADPWIVLTVISDVRTNAVPVRSELSEDGNSYTRTVSTMRDVAVQVRVESINADAVALADDLALELQKQTPMGILSAECVFVDDGPVREHRYRSRDLWIQARSFELFLRIVLEKTDEVQVGTIGTVKIQGTPIDLPPEVTLDEAAIVDDSEFTTEFSSEFTA